MADSTQKPSSGAASSLNGESVTAARLIEVAERNTDGDVRIVVGGDEPAELAYNRKAAVDRALATLREALATEAARRRN
jgi:hypothetical protein